MIIIWFLFYPKIFFKLINIFHDLANKQLKESIDLDFKKQNLFIQSWWFVNFFLPILFLFIIPILYKGGFFD